MTTIEDLITEQIDNLREQLEPDIYSEMPTLELPEHRYRISQVQPYKPLFVLDIKPNYEEAKLWLLKYTEKRKMAIVSVHEDKPLLYKLTTYYKQNQYEYIIYKVI